jgi:hypothetical protein
LPINAQDEAGAVISPESKEMLSKTLGHVLVLGFFVLSFSTGD